MNIPKYATPLYGLGAVNTSSEDVPNIAVPIKIASPGEHCDFDASANPQDVFSSASVCAMGLECDNGTCKEPGTGIPETILCQTDADCGDNFYCTNLGVCEARSGDIPPTDDEQDSQLVNCTDRYIIEQVQRAVGTDVDGKWGCDSQNALQKKGVNYRTVGSNCTGPLPNPCDYGQCVNGKCPSSPVQPQGGGGSGSDLVKVNEEQITDGNKEESKTPWGWIIGGIALAAIAAGGGYYYYSTRQKSKSPKVLKANEPARTKKIYLLQLEYDGYSEKLDNELYKIAGMSDSGFGFNTREHEWVFQNIEQARIIRDNLHIKLGNRIRNMRILTKLEDVASYTPSKLLNEPRGKTAGMLVRFEDEGKNVRVSNSDTSFVVPRKVFERGMDAAGFGSWIDSYEMRLDWEEWSFLIDFFNIELLRNFAEEHLSYVQLIQI